MQSAPVNCALARQFNGINVQSDQPPAGLKSKKNLLRMTAVPERAIHCDLTGLRRKHFQDFRDHDGPMRAGRRFAGRENFRDRFAIPLGIVFLVFVLESARILASVTASSPMRSCGRGIAGRLRDVVVHTVDKVRQKCGNEQVSIRATQHF